jgi:hypothetical protein
MRKIPLIIAMFYASILCSFGQGTAANDSANYKERNLKVDEVNFVSGYYQQDGDHSAVTGGIGTEKLTDIAGTIDLKLSQLNLKGNKHTLFFEMGADTYTSASSDKIDPNPQYSRDSSSFSLSGPSRKDNRIYPSLSYTTENTKKGITLGAGVSYSHEYDYQSRGVNLSFIKSSKDNNRELGVKLFAYFDEWTVIYPYELRPPDYGTGSHRDPLPVDVKPRNSFQTSFTLSQVINERMQLVLLFDPAYMQGQLTTLYQRVYFNDNSERVEKLPDTRFKIPVAIRLSYFPADWFIIRAYYRFYHDDWGNNAHTVNIEVPVKISPFFSLSPFYRYSKQTGIDYFAAYKEHGINEAFYTSDYDLSPFSSQFVGMGIHIAPPKGIFGIQNWNSLELRYGHYIRSTDLASNSVTLALKFK